MPERLSLRPNSVHVNTDAIDIDINYKTATAELMAKPLDKIGHGLRCILFDHSPSRRV